MCECVCLCVCVLHGEGLAAVSLSVDEVIPHKMEQCVASLWCLVFSLSLLSGSLNIFFWYEFVCYILVSHREGPVNTGKWDLGKYTDASNFFSVVADISELDKFAFSVLLLNKTAFL